MNTEKEVISAVWDKVTRPLDVSVDDAVQRNLWVSVVNSVYASVVNSVNDSLSNAIYNNISEYEY